MKNKKTIGIASRCLSNQIKREIDKIAAKKGVEGMTGMHLMIIGYIGRHNEEDIFQKNLEKRFNMRRSTATGILQLMTKYKLISRQAVDYDARLKKIVLTNKAEIIHASCQKEIELLETRLSKNLTTEEIQQYLELTEKILNNAKCKP
jgi:Transcriptional regulators